MPTDLPFDDFGGSLVNVLTDAMVAEGVDLNDTDAITQWLEDFNDRPDSEREAVLSDEVLEAASPTLTVVMPSEAEARASAGEAVVLGQLGALVEFLGDGHKLTQSGNLTLADARALVPLLQTGDRIDGEVGGRVFKTPSSAQLPRLQAIVQLATKARFVRKNKGRLLPTKAGRALGTDPLADLSRVVDAIDDAGMVSIRAGGGRFIWSTLAPFFDDLFVPLTSLLVTSPAGVPFDNIVMAAFEDFESEIHIPNPYWESESLRHDLVVSEMTTALETLESAGLVTWESETSTTSSGSTRRVAGTVRPTAAGRRLLSNHLVQAHELPIRALPEPAYSDLGFEALVRTCEQEAPNDFGRISAEFAAWVAVRGDDALDELIDAVGAATDPAIVTMGLAVLGEHFGSLAVPRIQALRDDPALRGFAAVWLVDHEVEAAEILRDPDPSVFTDILAVTLVQRGPEALIDIFDHVGDIDSRIRMLDAMSHTENSGVQPVLAAVARFHPDERVVAGAERARRRTRSTLRSVD